MTDKDAYKRRDELLVRIDERTEQIKDWCENHKVDDDKRHEDNLGKFDKIDNSLDSLKEFKWKSVGVVAAVLFLIDIAIKFVIK